MRRPGGGRRALTEAGPTLLDDLERLLKAGSPRRPVGQAMEALARGYLVRYTTLDDLVRSLCHADALGKLNNQLAQLQRPNVLVIDLCRRRDYADLRPLADPI